MTSPVRKAVQGKQRSFDGTRDVYRWHICIDGKTITTWAGTVEEAKQKAERLRKGTITSVKPALSLVQS